MSCNSISELLTVPIFLIVIFLVVVPTFFVIFSGCVEESKSTEYTGTIYDYIYDDSNDNLFIFLDDAKTQISIYRDSSTFTVMQVYLLVKNNVNHKIRVVINGYECSWFEILD